MNAPVTPARAALHDLIATMQALANLEKSLFGRDPSDEEARRYSQLEDRQASLEKQLVAMVQDQLGIDYATLWHAVTPTTKP